MHTRYTSMSKRRNSGAGSSSSVLIAKRVQRLRLFQHIHNHLILSCTALVDYVVKRHWSHLYFASPSCTANLSARFVEKLNRIDRIWLQFKSGHLVHCTLWKWANWVSIPFIYRTLWPAGDLEMYHSLIVLFGCQAICCAYGWKTYGLTGTKWINSRYPTFLEKGALFKSVNTELTFKVKLSLKFFRELNNVYTRMTSNTRGWTNRGGQPHSREADTNCDIRRPRQEGSRRPHWEPGVHAGHM